MYIDSHCHLNFPELASQLPEILSAMQAAQVHQAVVICTTMEEFGAVKGLAAQYPHLWATVGVHPDNEGVHEPSLQELHARQTERRALFVQCMQLAAQSSRQEDDDVADIVDSCDNAAYYQSRQSAPPTGERRGER